MRITFSQLLIAFIFTGISYAGTSDAQTVLDRPVDLSVNNVSLDNALQRLEKAVNIKFIYSSTLINATQKVSFSAKGEPLKNVLDGLLRPKNISYHLISNRIVLGYRRIERVDAAKAPLPPALANTIPVHIVQGEVTDEGGNLLTGVTVQVKNTSIGTVTDGDGRYSINATGAEDTLLFTYIGYTSREIPVSGRSTVNVQMQASAHSLNDVVVVGYGTQKRKDLTGAIGSIGSKEIARANPVNPYKALQGQVAGVNIAKTSGLPGQSYSIDIRGLGSINYSNEPLVVIDGVMGGNLNFINPRDIASIDVLKDASATAIYGSRGANGVIIVTTKKGTEGKAKITYDGYVGMKVPSHLPEMMNAQQYYKAYTTDLKLSGGTSKEFTTTETNNVKAGRSTDWVAEITRPALQTSHVLAVSGGTQHINYYFSGGYLDEQGNTMGQNYKRYNIKGSVDSKLNSFINAGFNTYYSYSIQNEGSYESLRSAYRARPTGSIYYDDLANPSESSDIDFNGYAVWMGINDHQVLSPLVEAYPGNTKETIFHTELLANGYVEVTPFKGLSIRSSLSASIGEERTGDYRGTFSKANKGSNKPTASYNTNRNESYTLDNLLTYQLKVARHSFTLTALQSAFKLRHVETSISVKDLPYNSGWYNLGTAGTITDVGSGLKQRTLLSYMGRFNYSFNDRYLLTLTGRWDGASVLAEGHKWGFFPSAAFAWRLVDEPFIRNLDFFSDMKLRVSYGLVGNDVVPPYGTQANLANTAYDFGGDQAYGFAPAGIANHELGWEKNKEVDLGLNLGFLNNRIMTEIDLYKRNTVDLILEEKLPISTGFNDITTNLGKVVNRGLEITLNTVNIRKPHFSWRTNITFSTNHNEILQLYGGDITEDIGNNLFVGQSLKSNYYYKFTGIWQLSDSVKAASYKANPGEVKVADLNKDGKIDADHDRMILGSQLPEWMGGMVNSFTYKNWDFSFMIYTRQGVQYKNSMESGTMGQITKIRYNVLNLNYWTPANPSNDYYGLISGGPYEDAIYYQDASYWRVSDITLGYRLPDALLQRWRIGNFRIYGQVNNPFVFTDFISFDPEYNSSTYIDDVPSTTYTFGVNVSF